ncbi:hypothetical protein [Paratractidigestivibacter sp.]|uniref:hypothetical protein n=1 Tax=Paratractidigestivibacter sp. TaxID=2847316 RepID=UPI002AC98490|nr:hypothetical protein [Paratractidigestivibacter sp.]
MMSKLIGIEEVQEATGMSKSFCYKLMNKMNAELAASGYLTVPGKVEQAYFESRLFPTSSIAKAGDAHAHRS